MPVGFFSKGHKKKPGSSPPQAPPSSPSAASVREHEGRTPQPGVPSGPRTTQPYAPVASPNHTSNYVSPAYQPPATTSSATGNPLADQYLLSRLVDLVTPGPTAAELAQAASTLGVKPKALSAGVSAAAEGVSSGFKELGKDAAEGVKAATELPDHRVVRAFGHKTLGTPTIAQLTAAERKGQLQLNRKGRITVPATRKAARDLAQARAAASDSGRIEGITHGVQAERFANTLAKLTGIDPKVVGAWVQAEGGGWGGTGVSGGEAGKNNWLGVGYPGEQTPFSQSPYFNRSPEEAAKATAAWMRGKIGGEYEYQAAPSIQAIIPQSKGKGPQAFLKALASSGWGTDVSSVAQDLGQISVSPANPQALQRLAAAKAQAQKLGIPVKANGDVEKGKGQVIYIRADAQGMVQWVESALGTPEGSAKQLRWAANEGLSGSQPWCANFVSNGLARRGVPLPPNPNYVPSYETEWSGGRTIGTDLSKAKPGDLIAYSGEHIAVYVGNGKVVSGNYGDEVAESNAAEGPAPVSAILRPNYKGGKVAVHESTPLPGSTFGGGEFGGSAPAGEAVAGSPVGGPSGGRERAPAPAISLGQVPVSPLLSVHSPLPRAFQQFELGEAPEEEVPFDEGVIAGILRGRRG